MAACSVIAFSFAKLPQTPTAMEIFFAVTAFASPFLLTKVIVKRFYVGKNKDFHLKAWTLALFILTFFYDVAALKSDGIEPLTICISVFNLLLVASIVIILSHKITLNSTNE